MRLLIGIYFIKFYIIEYDRYISLETASIVIRIGEVADQFTTHKFYQHESFLLTYACL